MDKRSTVFRSDETAGEGPCHWFLGQDLTSSASADFTVTTFRLRMQFPHKVNGGSRWVVYYGSAPNLPISHLSDFVDDGTTVIFDSFGPHAPNVVCEDPRIEEINISSCHLKCHDEGTPSSSHGVHVVAVTSTSRSP